MAEVKAHITGTVWKIEAAAGTSVEAGDPIVILESMKMEMPVESPCKGTVREIKVAEGQPVNEGALVAVVDEG
jgi:acetyl-CoA carboxylase biotin carboxyl carrier protein